MLNWQSTLRENGFLIIRNFFDEKEMERIHNFARNHDHDGSVKNFRCLLSLAGSECIFRNEKVKALVENLTNSRPLYFGDSSITINMGESFVAEGNGELHKDCCDRNNFEAPDWTSEIPYSVFRIGIYLDDYSAKSGGIAFRRASNRIERLRKFCHRKPLAYLIHFWELLTGKVVYSGIKRGDLAVWYLNTDHAANARFLRFSKKRAITKFTNCFPDFLLSRRNFDKRTALFLSFGEDDPHTSRYIEQNKTRDFMVNAWMKSNYPQSVVTHDYFFTIRDVGAELRELALQGCLPENSREWKPFPY